MRRLITRLLIAFGLFCPAKQVCAQSSARTVAESISRWVTTVDAGLSRTRRTAIDLPGTSTEGGRLVLYGIGGSLRKLVASYMGETGRAAECYYVQGDTLRYFSRREVYYDRPLSGHVTRSTAERLWFVGDSGDSMGGHARPRAARWQSARRARR